MTRRMISPGHPVIGPMGRVWAQELENPGWDPALPHPVAL